jgi:hypothetical protein
MFDQRDDGGGVIEQQRAGLGAGESEIGRQRRRRPADQRADFGTLGFIMRAAGKALAREDFFGERPGEKRDDLMMRAQQLGGDVAAIVEQRRHQRGQRVAEIGDAPASRIVIAGPRFAEMVADPVDRRSGDRQAEQARRGDVAGFVERKSLQPNVAVKGCVGCMLLS